MIEIFQTPPADFSPQGEAAACYIEWQGKILFLQRGLGESEPGTWGLPAGGLEKRETAYHAICREIAEETSLLVKPEAVTGLTTFYIRKPHIHYLFHLFITTFRDPPTIQLSEEHTDYRWATPQEALALPLMKGAKELLDYYCQMQKDRARPKTFLCVYLILQKADQVLLLLRRDTGYADGQYGLVAGHVEFGEGAKEALIREAAEEASIQIRPSDLHFSHCLHRKEERANLDLFFTCKKWEGHIANGELKKCEELAFFPIRSLPKNTIPYVAAAISHANSAVSYSEVGWN